MLGESLSRCLNSSCKSYGCTQAARLPLIRALHFTCVHGIAGMISSEPSEGGLDDRRGSQYS
eukprot:12913213-Heterocapsa_arctica.AAC.1